MKAECQCRRPRTVGDPRKKGSCVRCGKLLGKRWTSNNENFNIFFDRLESAFPGEVPDSFVAFRAQCLAREYEGRERFGFTYMIRDNLAESREEAADLCMYLYLDGLAARRAGKDEEESVALTAALHCYKAYEAIRDLEAKRHGAP